MHGVDKILEEASSLPLEERVQVVDSLLRSLNAVEPAIDREWAAEAQRRLEEIRSGNVVPVPGDSVFAKIRERFKR